MIFSRLAVLFIPVSLAFLLAACASPPRYANVRHEKEDPAPKNRASLKPYLTTTCIDGTKKLSDGCETKKEETFIGLAISGGGSRAANYAAAVMRELDSIGILQHVDAISSVSGGSLASAYVAAKGKKYDQNTFEFWEEAKRDLSQDFRSKLLAKLARPDNFISSMFGSLGRTELMAEVFDDTLFKGLTFGGMGDDGFGLLINATALNDLPGPLPQHCSSRGVLAPRIKWESVTFTDFFFRNCLNSNLDSYPLSRAVAASAAFPGLFSAVPLASYPSDTQVHFGIKKTDKKFLHVIDGGPSDNLGVENLAGSLLYKVAHDRVEVKQCLLIVIDAFAAGDIDQRYKTDDVRSPLDRLVDTDFFDSIDAMLNHRREATLRNLGQVRDINSNLGYVDDFPVQESTFKLRHNSRISKTSLRRVLGEERVFYRDDVNCFVWYLSIDGLEELVGAKWAFGGQLKEKTLRELELKYTPEEIERLGKLPMYQPEVLLNEYMTTDFPRRAKAVSDLASRVRTDFNLVGPKNCSGPVLSRALWLAGTISVNADILGRTEVCKWMRARGLSVSGSCESDELYELPRLPVKYVPTEQGDYSVACE